MDELQQPLLSLSSLHFSSYSVSIAGDDVSKLKNHGGDDIETGSLKRRLQRRVCRSLFSMRVGEHRGVEHNALRGFGGVVPTGMHILLEALAVTNQFKSTSMALETNNYGLCAHFFGSKQRAFPQKQ
jgi:hypothetical protein